MESPTGDAVDADPAAMQRLERAYREAVEGRQSGGETFRELERYYEWYLRNPTGEPDATGLEMEEDVSWARNVAKSEIEKYNDTIQDFVNADVATVFEAAKGGERHRGVYNDAIRKKQSTLEKSIASHAAQVKEHAEKLKHPEKYDAEWAEKDERQREGLLKKWRKDLQRNAEQAEIEIEVWKERFGSDT